MDLERIGSRHRDNSHHFAAESEALDQIAKEVKIQKNLAKLKKCSIVLQAQLWVQNCDFTEFFALRLKLD